MCGIAGILDPENRPEIEDLRRMLGAIAHRGPDDDGMTRLGPIAFGIRRLSILDPTPRGHQPMSTSEGRTSIVFNGEIYNFLELASELENHGFQFKTRT